MYRDLLRQAYSAMRHDLRRTVLTMAGMAWGIATVVLLLSYGNGFGKAIETIFQSFGATAVGVFPGRTSQQAGGNKAGVAVRFTNDDIELLRNNIPLCRHVVRMAQKDSTVQNNNRSFTFPVMGLDPSIQAIWNLDIAEGRFLDDADNMQHGLYAVIASEARDKLFSGMPAIGETIRIDGVTFEVIGVGAPRMQEGDNDNNRVIYIPYNSMDVVKDNHYLDGIWLDSAGLDHDKLEKTIRGTLALAHSFKPDDPRAVFVFDAQKQLSQFGIITMASESSARLYWHGHAGDRRRGADEHHAGVSHAAHSRDRSGEGSGRAAARHPDSISGRGHGDHRGRRGFGDYAFLRGFDRRRAHYFLQRAGEACRGRRHSTHRFAHDSDCGDFHPRRGRSDQRHGARTARRQSRSHRSAALRIGFDKKSMATDQGQLSSGVEPP